MSCGAGCKRFDPQTMREIPLDAEVLSEGFENFFTQRPHRTRSHSGLRERCRRWKIRLARATPRYAGSRGMAAAKRLGHGAAVAGERAAGADGKTDRRQCFRSSCISLLAPHADGAENSVRMPAARARADTAGAGGEDAIQTRAYFTANDECFKRLLPEASVFSASARTQQGCKSSNDFCRRNRGRAPTCR